MRAESRPVMSTLYLPEIDTWFFMSLVLEGLSQVHLQCLGRNRRILPNLMLAVVCATNIVKIASLMIVM